MIIGFQVIHHNNPSYSSIMQYKHLMLETLYFLIIIFCIYQLLLRSGLLGNEWLLNIINHELILVVYDDRSLNFFHHFFYVQHETSIVFKGHFQQPLNILVWHHRIRSVHNSNMPYKHESPYYHQIFMSSDHIIEQIFFIYLKTKSKK